MHRKKSLKQRRNIVIIAGCALAVIIAGCLVALFTAGGSNGNTDIHLQTVTQTASAAQVAKSLNCTGFKDQGAAALYSNDSGSCYIGSQKYAINTFPNQESRDSWLAAAEPLGVTPKWETATSVVYKSVPAA
jgi:hypothetical protein